MATYEVNDDQYPFNTVVHIRNRWGSSWYHGSGVIVGNNDVLTAAHVTYNEERGGWADETRIYPSYDPDNSNQSFYYRANWLRGYTNWDEDGDGQISWGDNSKRSLYEIERDICLISLNEDIGSTYGWMGLKFDFNGGNASKLGYPGKHDNNLMYDEGYIYKDSIDNYFWYYVNDIETNPGDSGGPLYVYSGEDLGYQVVGIHSASGNIKGGSVALNAFANGWISEEIISNNYLYDKSFASITSEDSVDEGSSISFTFKTHKSEEDKQYTYTLSGISSLDISSNELSGKTTINSDGEATFTIGISADKLTEGTETLTLSIGEKTKSISINDTSKNPSDINLPKIILPTSTDTATYLLYEGIPTLTINENITYVYTFSADKEVTWSLSETFIADDYGNNLTANDYTKFTINSSTGALTFNTVPDYENPLDNNGNNIYCININATDTAGNSSTQELWVTIWDVEIEGDTEKPIIYGPGRVTTPSSVLYMQENEKYIHTFVSNENVTWSLPSSWDENSLYTIDETSGVLSFKEAPDYENPSTFSNPHASSYISFYPVVRATDLAGNYQQQSIFLLVENIEDELLTSSVAANSTDLQQRYIGYFGRPCDPAGLDYWLNQQVTKKAFAANMYLQPEFNSAYGSLSTVNQVNQIYLNLFNRDGDSAGLTYWAGQIASGKLELASIANDLIYAALNNAGSEIDKKTLNNKTNAAILYTYQIRDNSAALDAYIPKSTNPWITGNNLTEAKTYIKGIGYSQVSTLSDIKASIEKFSITPNSFKSSANNNPNDSIDIITGLSLNNLSDEFLEDLKHPEIAIYNNYARLDPRLENAKLTYVEISDHLSNSEYIINLYDHILNREADSYGLNYWLGQLETGMESRFEVLLGFSGSAENKLIISDSLLL